MIAQVLDKGTFHPMTLVFEYTWFCTQVTEQLSSTAFVHSSSARWSAEQCDKFA